MAFIYDLSDTWNNAGISFNGIKLNATDTASASGSKLIDLQINGASKFTVGKTGNVIATGLIESTVGGFRFPDGTTQTTKATVNSVSGTGTVNGITLTGSVTNTGSLTLGGTLGNIANSQLTNSAITINGTSTPLGGSIAVGTVTSVGGTGTVSGLSLTGSITTSGSLTLGGTLVLTSGQVTDGLGYTPYNATNPAGYTTNVGTVTSVAGTGTVNGLTLTGTVTTSGSLTLGGTLGSIANSQLTNSAITINGTSTALGGSISVGTVTSVAALTLGTSGTDLASSVANGTTTPVITLNVPTASAVNRGALSSSDWSTFNAKQAALVSGTNIKTVGGASLLGSGDVGTIGLAYGGTGATTESGARTALGLGTAAVLNAGVAGGVATLDGSGTVPTSQLPGAVLGGLNYQGTWNASTNTPTLASSTGSKGYYYVVSVAGSTNLNGITDWKIGDWAVYDGTTWQKVDNTDAVSSVNGFTGAVVLSTSDVAQGTNLYFTQAAARGSVSAGTGISYDSATGVITNSAPDQTVALTGAGTTTVTGTYPNFTITSNDSTVGTVTSVGGTGTVNGITLTGTVTTSGNLTLGGTLAVTPSNFASQTANTVLAAPNGAAGVPTFRAIVAADIPTLNQNTTGTASNVTGTVAVANGGTGATTLSSGYLVKGNGTSAVSASVVYDDGTNVGIGTASPGERLTVAATANSAARITSTATTTALILDNTNANAWGSNIAIATGGTTAGFFGTIGSLLGSTAQDLAVYANTGNGFRVYTNGNNERMRITSAGLVGIGTTSPTAPLTVSSSSVMSRFQTGAATDGRIEFAYNTTDIGYMNMASATQLELYGRSGVALALGAGGSERMRITAAGNVGIGTTSPSTILHINAGAAADTNVRLQAGAAGNHAKHTYSNSSNTVLWTSGYQSSTGNFGISVGDSFNATGITITSAGDVGIGTSSPLSRLTVSGGYFSQTNGTITTFLGADGTGSLFGTSTNHYLRFITNDTERMRIDSSGNVSVATTNPPAYGAVVRIQGGLELHNFPQLNIAPANANPFEIVNRASGGFDLYPTPTVLAMRITSAGNVGIGTTSPATKFVVSNGGAGGLEFDTNGLIQSFNRSTSAYQFMYFDAAQILFRPSGTERMRLDASGNLGIGTSGPTSIGGYKALTLDAVTGTFTDYRENGVLRLRIGGDLGAAFINGASGTLRFLTGDIDRMRIDSSGNVGIGTSSPAAGYRLDVSGSANASGSFVSGGGTTNQAQIGNKVLLFYNTSVGEGLIQSADDASTFNSMGIDKTTLRFLTNNTERMRIDSSGNLLVGTTSAGGEAGLSIKPNESAGAAAVIWNRAATTGTTFAAIFRNGNVDSGTISYTNTATSYNTSSDYRLKDIDGPVADSGAYIDALKPVQGSWKADGSRFIGLLAHEVQEVSETPIATGEKDGEEMQAMDYSAPELIANLIAEIQSLRARVAQLEGN